MNEADRAFHDSMKPSWGPDGTLVYAAPSNTKPFGTSSRRFRERDGLLSIQKGGVVSESRDIHFAKFSNEVDRHLPISCGPQLTLYQDSAGALKKYQSMTVVDDLSGVPSAALVDSFSFTDFYDDGNARDAAAVHEKLVWGLAAVLFDKIKVPSAIRDLPNAADRIRKDQLSTYWQKLVDHASVQHGAMARSHEEKAIASLSGRKIADACGHLINGKNYHLATLVALVGKDSIKKDIREQLNEWQNSRVLSEFSQPIRAIYEIIAGNVCVCDGSKGAPVEDRIASFIISKRFGLDWRQAFGLRLWYGISANEELGVAVDKFGQDLAQDLETSAPRAWYVEQKIPTLWEDEEIEDREDLLWGLLKLYTFADADLEAIIRPENSQLSPLDLRLSWQLSRALISSGAANYNEDADRKADQLTLSFASQLTNEGSWLDAVFILLHLSSPDARKMSIQNHLAQHAGRIGSEDTQIFLSLTKDFKIPEPWVWEAKALYLRSVKKDFKGEVECLIKAGLFEEAHRTFSREVAPKTIIECDYETLRELLSRFQGKEHMILEWHVGGEIYHDFLNLLGSQKKATGVEVDALNRLLAGLPAVVEDLRHPSFMERVAIETISGAVAKTVMEMRKRGEVSLLML
jgi:nuclear pore complex protein Nup98-Nup96